jgi:hypothetical protein
MSVSLEILTQILADIGISSSLEEDILTRIKDSNTPPEKIEYSTSEESCISNDEQSFEQEIEEDEEELQHDLSEENRAYEILIEQWFQITTQLDQCFCFYLVSLSLQQLDSFTLVYFHFSFKKWPLNILLLLLMSGYIGSLITRN